MMVMDMAADEKYVFELCPVMCSSCGELFLVRKYNKNGENKKEIVCVKCGARWPLDFAIAMRKLEDGI